MGEIRDSVCSRTSQTCGAAASSGGHLQSWVALSMQKQGVPLPQDKGGQRGKKETRVRQPGWAGGSFVGPQMENSDKAVSKLLNDLIMSAEPEPPGSGGRGGRTHGSQRRWSSTAGRTMPSYPGLDLSYNSRGPLLPPPLQLRRESDLRPCLGEGRAPLRRGPEAHRPLRRSAVPAKRPRLWEVGRGGGVHLLLSLHP